MNPANRAASCIRLTKFTFSHGSKLIDPLAVLGEEFGHCVEALLYGDSVSLGNAEQLLSLDHVEGLYAGRTAWNIRGFLDLLEIAAAHQ